MRPARVLFPYVGDSVGGSHISSLTLARALPRDRFEPVLAIHEPGPLEAYDGIAGLARLPVPQIAYPRMIPDWQQPVRLWHTARALSRVLRQGDIDLVHSHDRRMHLAWGAGARAARIPHIWHQRTPKASARIEPHIRHAAAILTVSDFCRASFPPMARSRAEVIYNPFDIPVVPDRIAARARVLAAMEMATNGAVVGYVAHLDRRKDPLTFVAAAARIHAARPDTVFAMFGEPREPLAAQVRAAIETAGLGGCLRHLGMRWPIEDWISGCDLLLAPYRDEAFPRAAVEAALCGTVVVASDEGGMPELLQDGVTGRLVPPAEPEAFAAAALSLLESPATCRAMAEQARADALARLSLPAHLDAITKVYERILGDRPQ